jgi:tetratricopeptide (TPR) repeat protein
MGQLYLESLEKHDWEFVYPEEYHETMDELECAIEDMSYGDFLSAEKVFRDLMKKHPYHLDAYHHLALSRYRQRDYRQALTIWESVVDIGRRAFPIEFQLGKDRMRWSLLDNRPYLRCLNGLAITKKEVGAYGDALWLFRESMLLDLGDSRGARYNIGNILLTEGRDREFITFSGKYGEDCFAEFLYGKVLAYYRLGEKAKARQSLSDAVEYLPLVAEELAKKRHVRPKNMRDRYISLGGADQAYAYWEEYGALWKKEDGILEWLINQLNSL